MKPIYQTRREPQGNCLQAVIASLLEYPLSSVPDFSLIEGETDGMPAWWHRLQEYLGEFGCWFLEMRLPKNMPWNPIPFPGLCVLFGDTDNGIKHAVVGRVEGDKFIPVFNPWPEAKLTSVESLGFIIRKDPAIRC